MRILFDEDIGKGIPTALRAVGLGGQVNRIEWVRWVWRKDSVPDEQWMEWAARNGFLVFSCNKAILEAEAQRNTLISVGLGIVFLTTGQGKNVEVLQLVLRRWAWLETIDRSVQRPFAYTITLSGSVKRDPRV